MNFDDLPVVICVLRSGGDYGPEYVARLSSGVARHYPEPFRFAVLADQGTFPFRPIVSDLVHDWPGWWAKIELFRPGLFEEGTRLWYLDLDTVITGDLSPLLEYAGPPAVLADLYQPDRMIGSGVMTWRAGELDHIYEAFTKDPHGIMSGHRSRMDRWLLRFFQDAARVQDIAPGRVVSFKKHLGRRAALPPADVSVVCFHGKPRPADLPPSHPISQLWRASLNG